MNGLELNKIAAAILLAGIIAMVAGFVADGLYHPETELKTRGYTVAGAEEEGTADTGGAAAEEEPDILAYLGKGSAESGKALAKKCAACHNFDKGGDNKIGPALYGVVGRPKGSHAGYAYSDAMKGKGGNWELQDLSQFLHKPKKYVPGTKMVFAGLAKPEERADVIMYLHSLSDNPAPIPEYKAPEGAEEGKEPASVNDTGSADAKKGGDEAKDPAGEKDEADKVKSTDGAKSGGTATTAGGEASTSEAAGAIAGDTETVVKGEPNDKAEKADTRKDVMANAKDAPKESGAPAAAKADAKKDDKTATTQPADAGTGEGGEAADADIGDGDADNKAKDVGEKDVRGASGE